MPRTSRSWFSRFASAAAISTLSVLAACGETDAAPVAGTNIERDKESVRAVFEAVPETRPGNGE